MAKDIGDLLGIKNIRDTLSSLRGFEQKMACIRVWVRNIIKEIRLKGKYDLEEKLKEHQQLLQLMGSHSFV
jgi:hypothetical protein